MEPGGAFSLTLLDDRPNIIRLKVSGKNASKFFANEAGIHQWQRVPPTEKRGRVHTSTITVAVLPEIPSHQIKIDKRDLEWKATRGSGAGGQHRNVTDSAIQLTHKPTNIRVRCESARSQHANKETALQILAAKLEDIKRNKSIQNYNRKRKDQVGSGNRGENKTRIIRMQDDLVINNLNGKKISAKKYFRGQLEGLF
jgi:peptide chain release factor 1